MSSSPIEKLILPNGDECTLGDSEHYIKSSNYGIEDYDPDRRYRKNQAVWYKGDLFQSVDDNNRGNTPSYSSHYWMVQAISAYSFFTEQTYSLCRNDFDIWTDTQYFIGDLVNYNGVIYEFTDNYETSDWEEAEPHTRVFLGIQEGQDRDDYHNQIKWDDKFLFDINITDSDTSNKIVQFDRKNSYSSGTLVKNKSGRIMKLTADYTANDPTTFSAYNATIDEILQVLTDGGGSDLPSYIDIPEFNSSLTYEVGDYVKHDNNMYKCISEVDTPDTWDNVSSHFNYTTLPYEVKDASNNAADTILVKDFIGLYYFNESNTFGVGQFVIYNNSIFRCIKDHTGAWSYQDFVQYVLSPELQSFRVKTAGFGDSISQDFYNPNNTYSMGDYVFYTNDSVTGQYSLYKCIGTDVTGTWDSSKWTKVYILDELKALASASGGSTPIYYDISEYSESSTYEVGDYVKHNDNAYRAKYRIDNEAWDSDNFELITFPNDIRRAILHIPDVISLNATIIEAVTTIQIPSMSWKEIVNNSNGSIAKKERKLIVNIVRAGSSVNDIVEHQIIIDLTYYNGTATISGYYPIPVNSDGNIEQIYALVDISISETNSFVHSLLGTINFRTSSLTDAWEKVMGSPVSKSVKIMAIGFGQTY